MRKLRRSNLSEDAYTFVKDLLLNGERYRPGEKISVEELSRNLGVSRTPVWGAINRLEAEGVVEIVPRQGVYLINFDPEKAFEIYIAREALEGMAARLAAEKATARQLAQLTASLERQRACLAGNDVEGYAAAAMEFHQRIVEGAGNSTLARLLGSVYAQIQAMRARARRKDFPTGMPPSVANHERILAAIEARQPEQAEREARSHIRALSEEIEMHVERHAPEEVGARAAGGS